MNKIVSSLCAGVVVSVSCFSAFGLKSRYSLFDLNEGRHVLRKRVENHGMNALPAPKFLADLNGYGFGNDSLHWTWGERKASVFVNLRLSAATLRYYYPSLISYGQRLHTICTDGTAPFKCQYLESEFKYLWAPYCAVNQLFVQNRKKEFIQSWRYEIDHHLYQYVWDTAWAKNLGVSYTLHVEKDGYVMNSLMSLDTSHNKKTAAKGGATGVIGDNKFPGNQLKIFFDGALSRMIANQLDTPEKFTNWLLNNTSGVKPDFPAREALKRALISDGSWIPYWSEQPVWGAEKDEVSLLKEGIINHFTQIRNVAEKSASKDTGMVIKIVRWTIDVCDAVVEQQRLPHIYLTADGYSRNGSSPTHNRSYSCTFGWKKSVANLYLSDTSNIFYDRLTAYGGTYYDWQLGKEFRNSTFPNDLEDIKKLINGTMKESLVDLNKYVSWQHFQEMLQHALWIHQRINIQFAVFISSDLSTKRYEIGVKWRNT